MLWLIEEIHDEISQGERLCTSVSITVKYLSKKPDTKWEDDLPQQKR